MSRARRFGRREAVQQLHLPPFVLSTVDGHLEQATVQLHGNGSVIVSWHGVRYQAGITVWVDHADGGNVHLCSVSDGHVLLKHIVEGWEEDDEVWQADPGAVLDVGVGEEAALPVTRVGVLPTFFRRGLNQVAELTAAADEQYDATPVRDVGCEVQGQLKMLHCLVEVDDVMVQAAAVQVRLHEPERKTNSFKKKINSKYNKEMAA